MKALLILLMGVFLLGGYGPAWGDSTIESTFKSSGIKGMGASEGTQVRRYQGEKMWESSSSKYTGAVLSRVSGGSESVTITRVDKGVYWSVDSKNRSYSERTIEPLKKEDMSKEGAEKEKPRVRVTKSEFTVRKTGASETINGFPCEEYLITWLLEMEDLETKAKSRNTMTTNLWTTPETGTIRKAQVEEQEFHKAYARKSGVSFAPEEAKQLGMETLGAISGAPREEVEKGLVRVREEMSKVKGYPIRSAVNWTLEGDKAAATAKEEGKSSESTSESPKSIGGLFGGLAGRISQKMAGEKPSTSGGKEATSYSNTTEVRAISVDSIPAQVFEIPSGYVKK